MPRSEPKPSEAKERSEQGAGQGPPTTGPSARGSDGGRSEPKASEVRRLAVVGVMGSGREEHVERAEPLGRWLAREGVHLLTGGGAGTMTAVSRAFCSVPERTGLSLGVLPGDAQGRAPHGYPNPWIELAIHTHLPLRGPVGGKQLSRNHLNVLSSHVVVALPGGAGTSSEVALALRYARPIVAFVAERDEIPGLPAEVETRAELEGVCEFVRAALAAAGVS
jgi:uncharacterized protein (TIGR00725 family)